MGITKPERIVMRDDGMEALVAYGGFGVPYGIARIELKPDATMASVAQMTQIGTDYTPVAIAYADHDHAVMALASTQDQILGFTRQGTDFVAGTPVAPPAAFPLELKARHGSSDVMLSRSEVGVDQTLDIYRLQLQSDGTWTSTGAHAAVPDQPLAMAMHPNGAVVYSPTGDPSNPITRQNLTAPGLMHALKISPFSDGGTVATPQIGSLVAIDPGGHFLVTEGNVFMLDASNNPNVSSYTWQTVRLAPDGSFGDVPPPTDPKDGLLFDDLEISSNGLLVAMREMYPDRTPPEVEYPLELWAQPTWGGWQLCDTEYISGGAKVAISP
jgi:hypothetical protein